VSVRVDQFLMSVLDQFSVSVYINFRFLFKNPELRAFSITTSEESNSSCQRAKGFL